MRSVGSTDRYDLPSPGVRLAQRLAVLVVDDDPRVRAAIRATIDAEPDLVVVGEAANAVSALRLAAAVQPAVVLLDVVLPRVETGLRLLHELREGSCAVVAMSVRSGVGRSALAAGASTFVEKNGDIDGILNAVRAAATATS